MSDLSKQPEESELIFYQTAEGAVRVEVLYELESFWLNQKRIAELFGVELSTVSYHLKDDLLVWRALSRGNSSKNSKSSN
jgi:hypothetical protein